MTEQPREPRPSDAPSPSPTPARAAKRSVMTRFLDFVEWLGNLLPHPVTLFAIFALLVVLVSGVCGWLGVRVEDPRPEGASGRAPNGMIEAVSLMNEDGLRRIVENLVTNFTGFVPLGTVLVALLGVGVAEKSGLLGAAIRALVLNAPKSLITMAIVFAGVVSNTASEMGYVVLVPLAAVIFHSLGRHPLAGLAAAFAGVSGGYSANILIGTVDPLLAGITQEAARLIDPAYEVHPAVNWYFMFISTFLITIVGTLVTVKIVEPKLGPYDPSFGKSGLDGDASMNPLTAQEKRALKRAALASVFMVALIVYFAGPHFVVEADLPTGTTLSQARQWDGAELRHEMAEVERLKHELGPANVNTVKLFVPEPEGVRGGVNTFLLSVPGYGALRNPTTNDVLSSPLLRGLVALIFVFFLVPGFVYGRVAGTMKNDRDVIDAMSHAMSTLGLYIVLVFFAAQFVNFFNWTNLGSITAVVGADLLEAMHLTGPLVFIPFILMCCFVNLMLGSASAQWAVTAPIFVPMLMLIGYSPEVIQAAYRIGDSTTNIITPMMSYFGLILAFVVKYDKRAGIGTMISMMLPYTVFFIIGWVTLFYCWVFWWGLPVGPGAPTYYTPGTP